MKFLVIFDRCLYILERIDSFNALYISFVLFWYCSKLSQLNWMVYICANYSLRLMNIFGLTKLWEYFSWLFVYLNITWFLLHCNCTCRLWQEQVLQFFNLKLEHRSWSQMLELKVCCVWACVCKSLITYIAINKATYIIVPFFWICIIVTCCNFSCSSVYWWACMLIC